MGDFNINLLKDQALEILTMLPGVTQTIKKFDGLSCTLLDHIYVKNLKMHTAVRHIAVTRKLPTVPSHLDQKYLFITKKVMLVFIHLHVYLEYYHTYFEIISVVF